jgi:hypothetical protein
MSCAQCKNDVADGTNVKGTERKTEDRKGVLVASVVIAVMQRISKLTDLITKAQTQTQKEDNMTCSLIEREWR